MVHNIPPLWSDAASAPGQQRHSQPSQSFGDVILAVALAAMAIVSANAFDRTKPGLATLLRCVAGGVGLFWIFSKCFPSSTRQYMRPADAMRHTPPPAVLNPQRRRMREMTGGFPFVSERPAPPHQQFSGVRQSQGFPTVHRAPAQSDSSTIYPAAQTRDRMHATALGGFPAVARASAQPALHQQQSTVSPPPFSHAPQQPAIMPSQSSTSSSSVMTAPPPHRRGTADFPTVHRAPAQSDSSTIYPAAQTRDTTQASSLDSDVNKVPTTGGQGRSDHSGNGRTIFPAATRRS